MAHFEPPAQDPADLGLKLEALKCGIQLLQWLSKRLSDAMPPFLAACWALFQNALPSYQEALLQEGDAAAGAETDSDGQVIDLSTVVVQLFLVLALIASKQRYRPLLQQHLQGLCWGVLGFMQLSLAQEQTFSLDGNAFISEEFDETYSIRQIGADLLYDLLKVYKEEASEAALQAVSRRLQEAQEAQAAGDQKWWRVREAVLLGVGHLNDKIAPGVPTVIDSVLTQELKQDVLTQVASAYPYLLGRCLWMGTKLASILDTGRAKMFFEGAVAALDSSPNIAVKVCACRLLCLYCSKLTEAQLQPYAASMYQHLDQLMKSADEDTLSLILETLAVVIKSTGNTAASYYNVFLPPLLQLWSQNYNDPLLATDVQDVLKAYAAIPACLRPLLDYATPTLSQIIANPSSQETGLVVGSLDLLTVLVLASAAQPSALEALFTVTYPLLMNLLQYDTDFAIMQSATQLLRALVAGAGEAVVTWGSGDPAVRMQQLLQKLEILLSPQLEESASFFIGHLLLAILRKLPGQLQAHLEALVGLLVTKLLSTSYHPLRSGLVLAIAKITLQYTDAMVEILSRTEAVLAAQQRGLLQYRGLLNQHGVKDTALHHVFQAWTEVHLDLPGSIGTKISTQALMAVMQSGNQRIEAVHIMVDSAESLMAGIQTRRQKAAQPNSQALIGLRQRLVQLLLDTVKHEKARSLLPEQAPPGWGQGDSGDWVDEYGEVDESDEDADDDDEEDDLVQKAENAAGVGAAFADLIAGGNVNEEMKHIFHKVAKRDYQGEWDALDEAEEPAVRMDIEAEVCSQLRSMAGAQPQWFSSLAPILSSSQQKALQEILSS